MIAFLAQLAVLPGETVQFIIAGLSTRYDPLGVVAATSVAFAGSTALEIWFAGLFREALSVERVLLPPVRPRFDRRTAHFGAAALFAFFGLDTLLAMVTGYSHATPLAVRVSMARWERNPTATAILSVRRLVETRIAPTTNPPATGVCNSPR